MGVKSLWNLLEPVGRPVLLETVEGKSMAIDSSIWIYQFQATMRDKEGRGLANAHVVGFLRRICKLLFYGIQPVFVFDGGAPALKRSTIAERKSKKSGAAATHAKVAERLLAAQMRREALNQAKPTSKGKGKVPSGPVTIDENTVYLEDLISGAPQTPEKQKSTEEKQNTPPSSSKKARWRDHDPYKLPEINMNDVVAKATGSHAPDPRLATDDELRAFIDEMRPEDFDVTSPAFRELSTEVQYEIIGDLRLKSRQTSYKRLQNMLRNAKTPLDFSKEQIKNLKQRNTLTQQLLTTTDSIGKAHVAIPIRIASERNKQYLLIKNEGEVGGWILGIRDEGTRSKPIEIDQDIEPPRKGDDDSDMDMEEVDISTPVPILYDPDLREYRRDQALSALTERYSPKKLAPLTTKKVNRKPRSKPLFALEENDLDAILMHEDPELSAAIQESLELEEEAGMQRAIEASRADTRQPSHPSNIFPTNIGASSSRSTLDTFSPATPLRRVSNELPLLEHISDDDDLYASPTRLETALSIGGAGPSKKPQSRSFGTSTHGSLFGVPSLLLSTHEKPPEPPEPIEAVSDSEDDMEEVPVVEPAASFSSNALDKQPVDINSLEEIRQEKPLFAQSAGIYDSDDGNMEEVVSLQRGASSSYQQIPKVSQTKDRSPTPLSTPVEMAAMTRPVYSVVSSASAVTDRLTAIAVEDATFSKVVHSDVGNTFTSSDHREAASPRIITPTTIHEESDSDNDSQHWSRTPSPTEGNAGEQTQINQADETWDAAQEMDPHVEEGEFARFISQVRGKDLDTVRREIDEEIKALNQQRKAAMRDSEDITQQMISQIMMMLRLFGIPYITAPMEAEAQCAELLSLELVDGIITDDSDVFLFGGARVFKNMFNQSKTVECFLLSDLERELGLDRDKLVRLAYLLGSDYTEGLPGVGPVVAMELLTEFSGMDGLHRFREWWRKVQSGKDTEDESQSRFRKRFKKRFKDLYLPEDWPNPAVRDAYYHPTVDHSEEPFKWGLPDLDALRNFLNSELGWNQQKVDDLLLPIIQKMNKRTQQGALTKQGNLNAFFDVPAGGAAPRKRQAYASKRLQQVVKEFRAQQKAGNSGTSADDSSPEESGDEFKDEERPMKKRKSSEDGTKTNSNKRGGTRGRGRGRGRRGGNATRGTRTKRGGKTKAVSEPPSESDCEEPVTEQSPQPSMVNLRPRPKPRPAYKGAQQATDEGEYGSQ